jgi:hypothetical protein
MVDIGHSGVSLQVLVRIGVKVELSRRTEQGLGIATSVQPREKHRKPLPLLLIVQPTTTASSTYDETRPSESLSIVISNP